MTEVQMAGKYDAELTAALISVRAKVGFLIVVDGKSGPGFSARVQKGHEHFLINMLRVVADSIESGLERKRVATIKKKIAAKKKLKRKK